jgi:hypothetical protein
VTPATCLSCTRTRALPSTRGRFTSYVARLAGFDRSGTYRGAPGGRTRLRRARDRDSSGRYLFASCGRLDLTLIPNREWDEAREPEHADWPTLLYADDFDEALEQRLLQAGFTLSRTAVVTDAEIERIARISTDPQT